MDDIQRQDRRLFIRELLRPGRIFLTGLGEAGVLLLIKGATPSFAWAVALVSLPLMFHAYTAFNASVLRRFKHRRFEALWHACQDRLERFEEVLGKMRKEQVADLSEMPKTIRRVGESLYSALRRADMISYEVQLTEKGIYQQAQNWQMPSHDAQAKELYQIADKNIAEYRQNFAGVMAGVQRAEAQSAVYMTTLDSLRMKMIGYRLVGKSPELNSQDFIEALGEAKLQLQAIDQALEELDFRQTVFMGEVPPPVPNEAYEHLQQNS